MTRQSTLHNWTIAEAGVDHDDWGAIHEDFHDDLDIDVEVRDTDANRSNYSPESGAKFFATDTGTIYLGDGSSWNELGTIGSGGDGAPTDATYVTTDDESTDLTNSSQHANLSGADLHSPATHSGSHESGGADELSVAGLSGDLADPQDPKSHDNAAHSETYTTTSENVENFATGSATAGEVARSQGDGTLLMETLGHGDLATEPFAYDPGMTKWEDGLSNEEIDRIALQTGETLVVERIEFRQKGGGSSTSASIDVYDATAAAAIGSQDLGGTTKDPGSSGSANTVIVRVNNATGGAINAAPRVTGYIEGA